MPSRSTVELSAFSGFRFPPEVIVLAVRWYLRFGLSDRDLEELLAERGIEVDHATLYRWVQRFTPELIDTARPTRHAVGDRWFVDETYVKVAGVWRYVYRAVDQRGQVIDLLVRGADQFAVRGQRYGEEPPGRRDVQFLDHMASAGARSVTPDPLGLPQHDPIREQPGRMRPRPAQSQAATDARPEERPIRNGRDPKGTRSSRT